MSEIPAAKFVGSEWHVISDLKKRGFKITKILEKA